MPGEVGAANAGRHQASHAGAHDELVDRVFDDAGLVRDLAHLDAGGQPGPVGRIGAQPPGAVAEPLWGQAGRQVFFAAVSLYGWWRWSRLRDAGGASDGRASVTWAANGRRSATARRIRLKRFWATR